jgi:F-type H+-transporting ATPase subunit a
LRFVQAFINLTTNAFGFFHYEHVVFVISLFLFILLANMASLLPWVEEPTKDLNTTLACAIIAFFYVQTWAIKTNGIRAYLAEYTTPFFLMAPLHVIGKLSSIVSLSFRLFGNIFGGATIIHIFGIATQGVIIWELAALPVNLITSLFFVGFEGFLQAFVFTMLTTTYLALAIQPEEEHHA